MFILLNMTEEIYRHY